MLLGELDQFLNLTLDIPRLSSIDASLNGLQVSRTNQEIRRVACAVDASMETFKRAATVEADLLFVHHGLFWGASSALRRSHYSRVRFLIESELALYAVHLPLDLDESYGNNVQMAKRLGLAEIEPFGEYRGVKIGFKGRFPSPASIEDVLDLLRFDRGSCTATIPSGPARSSTVGIVSGGGTHEVEQAVSEELDLYITGDATHTMYHYCLEESINLLCAGHYQTETFGVRAIGELIQKETDIETTFIDVPTGL